MPNNIPEKFVKDYILGYFDGDGSCFLNFDKTKLFFSIVCTHSVRKRNSKAIRKRV